MCVAIGAQILHAVGIAWAFKLRKEDRVTLVYSKNFADIIQQNPNMVDEVFDFRNFM